MLHDAISPPSTGQEDLQTVLTRCAEQLSPLLPRIASVIKDREDDFLHLGGMVFSINSRTGTFSANAADLAAFVGEDALQMAIAELQDHTVKARDIFAQTSSEAQIRDMSEAIDLIRELDRAMQDFAKLVRALQVLEITTRIESARLGSAGSGFTTLADDVRSLSTKIAAHVQHIREHARLLMQQVVEARDRTTTLQAGRSRQVDGIFANLFSGIDTLESMREQTASLATGVAQSSKTVAGSMAQIISSVQFHDITRQQVEHVQEILDQVRQEVAVAEEAGLIGLAAWTRDVLHLQAPQLQQAREMFCSAVEELITNLRAISGDIDSLGNEIASIGHGERGEDSTLAGLHSLIAHVVEAMRDTGREVTETSRSMQRMATTIAEAGAFVEGIEDIGMEIELIALNASVKAAHTGDMGRALGVLAVEIQHLSVRARTQTSQAASTLHGISEVAGRLASQAEETDIETDISHMQTAFEQVLIKLAGLNEELELSISQLSGMSRDVAGQLHELADSVQFHGQVAREMQEQEQELRRLETCFTPFAEKLDAARQPEKLREQLHRYTMDSERLVHAAVLGDGSPEDDENVDLFGDDDGVELFDDNVELFGSDDGVELFDENIELFDEPPAAPAAKTAPSSNSDHGPDKAPATTEKDEDFGDNVELF